MPKRQWWSGIAGMLFVALIDLTVQEIHLTGPGIDGALRAAFWYALVGLGGGLGIYALVQRFKHRKTKRKTKRNTNGYSGMNEETQRLYEAYDVHARTLRTWLIAYGIGGPILLLTTNGALESLTDAGVSRLIGMYFFTGVVAQVFLAFLNKNAMWWSYFGILKDRQSMWWYRFSDWLSQQQTSL